MSQKVESVCFDISLGLAYTSIGQLFLWATSECENSVPESIDHVGIKVFGYFYEYGDYGTLRTKITKSGKIDSKYPTFRLRSVEDMGETEKSQKEFEDWISELNKTDFRGSLYDIVGHNCIVWATLATQFLGVSYPKNWDKIRKYARKNSLVASALGTSIVSSRQTTTFDLLGPFE